MIIKQFSAASSTSPRQERKTIFKGELETRFFNAVRNKNKQEQLVILNNIKFDVFEKDPKTGNNFLHIACREGTPPFIQKAIKLLRINKDKVQQIISSVNAENKCPLDYLKDNSIKQTIYSALGGIVGAKSEEKDDVTNETIVKSEEKVGNEIDEAIDLGGISFGDEEMFEEDLTDVSSSTKGLASIIGLKELKQTLENEIIKPLSDNRNVFTNGFLLHGLSGNGKTFTVEKLAEELNKEIIDASLLIATSAKDAQVESETEQPQINTLIENSIIRINPDEIREISSVANILKKYYIETNKQGIVFIDEIQKFFPENITYINNIRAMQSIENSARNGMILLATTKNIEDINSSVLNSLRFEKIIELKPPKKDEIIDLISAKISEDTMSNEEITKLARRMNGLSYNDIARIIERAFNKNNNPTMNDINSELESYAKLYNITDLNDEGTTSNYDVFQKRVSFSVNDPKSLDDVIGMNEVKNKLRKIFTPIKKEELLKDFYIRNKIKKPNGILLYGPPGCGKTFIMNALAAETKLPMYQVKISDIGSSYINQTEKNIKKIFDQLRKKYKETGEASILFFDECDSLFAKSNNTDNRNILNTLKEEMNNAGDDGIFIVAATNEKDNLNTAIVRDGRFDTKIEVGYPDEEARIGLISRALKSPIFATKDMDAEILELARLTKGLSNATITGIFSNLKYSKASKLAEIVTTKEELDKYIETMPIKTDEIKSSIVAKKQEINKMNLKQKNIAGLDWLDKTAVYDEFLDRTFYTSAGDPKSLDDVIGMDDVKKQMKLKIIAPLNPKIKKYYDENKIPTSSGIILYGPGGVGKTFIIRALAAEAKIPLYELNLSEQGSSYINETSNNIKKVFNQLKKKYKETGESSILFLDEADSILGYSQGGTSADQERTNILNTLKEELANASNNGIVVVAATNNYNNLDPNVIRSGRFNDHIKIDYPDAKARGAYLIHVLKSRKVSEGLANNSEAIKELTELTKGLSNADIKACIEHAVINSQEEFVDRILNTYKDNSLSTYTESEFKSISLEELTAAILRKQQERAELSIQNNFSIRGSYENI